MAYYTGTANDMTAVRSALVDACVAEGWAWNSSTDMLSKGTIFVRLALVSGYLRLYGRATATTDEMPVPQQMGPFTGSSSAPLPALEWPVTYRIFVFAQEVYCVIQYSVDVFQWCAFGKSTVSGLPGIGTWVVATAAGAHTAYIYGIRLTTSDGQSTTANLCAAPFWATGQTANYASCVFSDLDAQGWWAATTAYENPVGVRALTDLIKLLPNSWNSEAVLLPIRGYKIRPSNKISLITDLEHARYTRIDNYAPAEVITIGADRWMILPFCRKNTAQRDGGYSVNHTGTFGWAIRYEGP